MKPRRIKLASGTWRFLIDSHETTLWTPSGKRCRVKNERITGAASHSCYRYEYPGNPCPGPNDAVTPGHLRAYIEAQLESM